MQKTRLFIGFFISLYLLCVLSLAVSTVADQEGGNEPTDDEVNTIARQMYCPVCENVPLDVCNTQACSQWRELIRQKLRLGWNEDQIKKYFVEQYGDRVLATPPLDKILSWNLLVYIIPPIILISGIIILFRQVKKWQKQPAKHMANELSADDKYITQFKEEIEKE